jgi:hypothetical protein
LDEEIRGSELSRSLGCSTNGRCAERCGNCGLGYAIKRLSEGGEVKINIPHRVYRVYGRQLSIQGADGSRSAVALFDFNRRLYQIEGKALPGGNPLDMLRFQQSLVFTGGGSNRSPEAIRAIREGCRAGVANPAARTTRATHGDELPPSAGVSPALTKKSGRDARAPNAMPTASWTRSGRPRRDF